MIELEADLRFRVTDGSGAPVATAVGPAPSGRDALELGGRRRNGLHGRSERGPVNKWIEGNGKWLNG